MDIFMDMSIQISNLTITPEILYLIAEIDEFKGAWRAFDALTPERLSALQHVATIESIGSSTRIEGSRLSDRNIEQLLSNGEINHFETRDEQEVSGYAAAMETVFSSYDNIVLTENHIKQLHRDLLIFSQKDERHRGAYKTHPNNVSAFDADGKEIGIVFETATPFDTRLLMEQLVSWTNESFSARALHPLLIIAIFVVVFLQIHPFQDGNGRLSRILTTLLLLQSGYTYVLYSSLESVIERSKESYYRALHQTQKTIRTDTPDWQPWNQFFLRALQQQKRRLEKKITREKVLLKKLPEVSMNILELVHENGRLTNAQIVELTNTNRNTVKKHLSSLVRAGFLTQNGHGKGTWYVTGGRFFV